jgi:uncharacterized membrane protein
MRRNNAIYAMSVTGLMIAILCIFGFTPIGTIQTPVGLTITLIGLPVAIVCCVFGPWMGALMGFVWGTISLIQGVTGMDPTGPVLFAYSPFGLIFTCYVPRILTGLLAGAIYDLNRGWDNKGYWSALISSALVSIFNTGFFMSSYCLFFYKSGPGQDWVNAVSKTYPQVLNNVFLFIVFAVGLNFLVELGVNAILGSAAAYGIQKAAVKIGVVSPFRRQKKENEKAKENESGKSDENSSLTRKGGNDSKEEH